MTFKEKLVILRKSRGLTQDEFASAVGVSRQAVYKWESGQSYPEVPKLLEIKMLFTISIDELLDDSYDIPVPEKKKRKRAPKAAPAVEAAPVAQPAPAAAPAPKAAPVAKATPTPAPTAQPAPKVAPAPAAAPAPKAEPAVKAAPVAQPAPANVAASAPKAEPNVNAPAVTPATKVDTVPAHIVLEDAPADEEPVKKTGFFDRLFGRR